MPDPINLAVDAAKAYGINAILMLAGFAGSAISFSYMKPMTKAQMVMTLFAGLMMANYLPPIVMWALRIPADFSNGTAFLIGLFGMPLLPLVLARAKRWLGADATVGS